MSKVDGLLFIKMEFETNPKPTATANDWGTWDASRTINYRFQMDGQ